MYRRIDREVHHRDLIVDAGNIRGEACHCCRQKKPCTLVCVQSREAAVIKINGIRAAIEIAGSVALAQIRQVGGHIAERRIRGQHRRTTDKRVVCLSTDTEYQRSRDRRRAIGAHRR